MDLDDIFSEWEESLDYDLGERDVQKGHRAHVIHDYNLDSAILPDLHTEMINDMRTPGVRSKNIQNYQKLGLMENINWDNTLPISEFPKLLPILMEETEVSSPFNDYYDWDLNDLFQENKKVVDEFLEFKKIPNRLSHINMSQLNEIPLVNQIKESFLIFNFITEVINSSTTEERAELSKRLRSEELQDFFDYSTVDNLDQFMLRFRCKWGTVSVVSGWCYFHQYQQLLTRPMILMLKDTLVARYDSSCALYMTRFIHGTAIEDVRKLLDFYNKGDVLLSKYGNKAFDIIKMVEGSCTVQFTEIAASRREEVPTFDTYKNHMNREILKWEDEDVKSFFEIIFNEGITEMAGVYYSCFRHWGHPVVDCDEGLKKLHSLVTEDLPVDDVLSEELGSNFAEMVLTETFTKTGKWYVDLDKTDSSLQNENKGFFACIKESVNITAPAMAQFGDQWHKLEYDPVFEVPDHVDPSVIYDDKGHSVNRAEFLDVVNGKSHQTSRRVLARALKEEVPNVGEFLKKVNDHGLPPDDLIIGLKAKERELKILARFFSLMTWNLRLYFVLTEYLIKQDLLPFFPELTMADSGVRVVKKMLSAMAGHGCPDASVVTVTTEIDYKKWNNKQRKASSFHVFSVMGKLYGLPNLFTRTHDFFRDSWVYYSGKAGELSLGPDGVPVSPEGKHYFWTGQQGGFEGLRQKGWTILSALILRRTLKVNVTKSVVLAQGDNQVISLKFRPDVGLSKEDLRLELLHIKNKVQNIMASIFSDVRRLGMEINMDETVTSTGVLTYGKKIFVLESRVPLPCKIFSRATCSSNDQLPSLPTLISSIVTMSLTSAQESDVASIAMYLYVYFAIFTASNLLTHNVLARRSFVSDYKDKSDREKSRFWLTLLFLDPALGGAGGASLSRFLVRGFPDPVTESLAFYKVMTQTNIPNDWKYVFTTFGDPTMGTAEGGMRKLLENPLSINIARPANAVNIVKDKIKDVILQSSDSITNSVLKELFAGYQAYEEDLISFISSIKPCFPRFNSELHAATHVGVANDMMSLFQNSRTLRTCFGNMLGQELHKKLVNVEYGIINLPRLKSHSEIWDCSSSHADKLRQAWGVDVVGVTIPHPLEHIGISKYNVATCEYDNENSPFVNVSISSYVDKTHTTPGPMEPYLGASTSEGAKNFNNWERTTSEPVIKRAGRLRRSIGWLFPSDSNLTLTIFNNLKALTGVSDWDKGLGIYYRSGCPFHRFNSSRQASGGFSAINPNYLRYLSVSTDTLETGTENFTFMFQSDIIYAQAMSSEFLYHTPDHTGNHHYHLGCDECMKKLGDCNLVSKEVFTFPNKSDLMKKMGYNPEKDSIREPPQAPKEIQNLDKMDAKVFSKIIGFSIGHTLSVSLYRKDDMESIASVCSTELQGKVLPQQFLDHFFEGVYNGAIYKCILQYPYIKGSRMRNQILDSYWVLLEQVVKIPELLRMLNHPTFHSHLLTNNLSSSSRYPDNLESLSLSLIREAHKMIASTACCSQRRLLIPSDCSVFTNQVIGLCVSRSRSLLSPATDMTENRMKILWKLNKQILSIYLSDDPKPTPENISELAQGFSNPIIVSRSDIRTLAKSRNKISPPVQKALKWRKECNMGHKFIDASSSGKTRKNPPDCPSYWDSLFRGLRLPRFSTGAYLKLVPILEEIKICPKLSLCLADGSGGFCSYILRRYSKTRSYFNSLLEAQGNELGGRQAGAPSALQCLSPQDLERCDNYATCWQDQGDLTTKSTWDKINTHITRSADSVGLITVDINHPDNNEVLKILLSQDLLWTDPGVLLIYKVFTPSCLSLEDNTLDLLNRHFFSVKLSFPNAQSYGTNEIYAVCTSKRPDILKSFTTSQSVLNQVVENSRSLNIPKERRRTREFLEANQFQGVPDSIRPQPNDLLMSIFGQFNMNPSTQNTIRGFLEALPEGSIELRLDLIEAICICCFVPFHRSYTQGWAGLSDNELIKINSLRLAKLLYLSAREGDYEVIEDLAKMSQCSIQFSYEILGTPGILTYRFTRSDKLARNKCIKRTRDIPFEAFIIRALHLALGDLDHKPETTVTETVKTNLDKRLKQLNYAWSLQHIFDHTGLMHKYSDKSHLCSKCVVRNYMKIKTADTIE